MKSSTEPFQIENDQSLYIGIRRSLTEISMLSPERRHDHITLEFNADGLPISGSSGQQYWPVLMSTNIDAELIAVVSVFYGTKKPTAVQLLETFVQELSDVLQTGFDNCTVTVRCITADLPATCLLKSIIGHTAKDACSKCTYTANWLLGRACYPLRKPLPELRTDVSFRQQTDIHHHCGFSPFQIIESLDMVDTFTIDPMHTIYQV
jgi:hypothetical protein